MSARRRSQDLAFRLLAFYLLFVVPVLGVALWFDAQASHRLQADVSAADLSLAEAIALETDALLLKARQAVEAFAQMPAVIEMDRAGMKEAFATGAAARQDINLFYRLDAEGIMVFHHPTGPGSTVGVDFSFRDYFQAALTSEGAVFSKGRISPTTERPVATVVMPIRVPDADGQDSRFDGVVATNLELERLTETLVVIGQDPARPNGEGGQGVGVAIVDAAGQIIAHSQPDDHLLQNVLDTLPGVPQVLAGERGSLIAREAAPPGGEKGREWLYSYAPIPTAGWGVVVQRPTEIAFATSRAFHRGLLLAIGLIALGATLFWWALTHRVIQPLEQLTRFSRTGGPLTGRQPGPGKPGQASLDRLAARQDQVGDLARTLLRRLTELETLLETSTAVVSSLDTEQVIDSILEQVQRLLGVETCAVLVQDEDTGQLTVRASRGLSQRYVQNLRLDATMRSMPAWRAIDSGQPVQVPDVEADPAMTELLPLVRSEGYRALLDVPLVTPHGPPAVLVIYRTDPHHFGTEEVNLAVTFANQAAMALENATLFGRTDEELQKQVRSLSALNQVMRTASQSLVLDDVLNNALEAVVQVMEADAAWIYLLREGETTLRLRAQRGLGTEFARATGEIELGQGLNGRVAQTGEALLIQEIGGEDVPDRTGQRLGMAAAAREGLRSLAAVPLRAQDIVVGVLGAATRSDRCFSAAEVELLSAIGSQVGISVENARLYQRSRQVAVLEERNRLAREIHDALAQGLTGIIVQLEAMERLAQRRPEQALVSLQRAKDLARRSLQEARRSVWGLRPRSLEDMTLAEALQARVEALREECQLQASLGLSGPRRILSPDVELNLFRIAQEALVNVQRHAQAEIVHVQLDFGHAHLRLVIEDNGVGLPQGVEGSDDGHGFGLTGMRERAALLGGQMTVTSEPGQGMRVEVIVPG